MHYRKRVLEALGGRVSPHDENVICITRDDGEHHFIFTWHDINHHGRKFGYLVEITEVTKIFPKLRLMEAIAYYDPLTHIFNRNAYIEQARYVGAPENMPLLVMLADANKLKKLNDERGHLVGDKLLMVVVDVIKDKAPEDAFIARLGGGEIVVLMRDSSEKAATTLIDRVTDTLNAINDPDIGTPKLSWGYSVMKNAGENYNDVFTAAAKMMAESRKKVNDKSLSGIVP